MSLNFSTTTNNSSLSSQPVLCEINVLNLSVATSAYITRALLLLPLSILILFMGAKRWREKHSFAAESHSDIFTYHVAILELLWVSGVVCFYCDVFKGEESYLTHVAMFLFGMTWYGGDMFHVLTCAERYLAVVHPIIYRLQKNGQGVKIRNISIGCSWLLCISVCTALRFQSPNGVTVFVLCPLLISAVILSFFSFSVLCVLKRPGPGEEGRGKALADQMKQRAFFTIMAVTGVIWLWFLGVIVAYSLRHSSLLSRDARCLIVSGSVWFNVPSSLVLPLLYLQRAGKLKFCFRNTQSR